MCSERTWHLLEMISSISLCLRLCFGLLLRLMHLKSLDRLPHRNESRGGEGVIQELYDFLVGKGIMQDATEEAVAELKQEASSAAMK